MDRRSWAQNVKALKKRILSKIKLAQVKLWLLGNYLAVFSQRLGENIPSRSCKDSMVACWNLAFFPLNRRRMRSTLSTLSLIASTKLIAFLKSRPSESSVPGVSARQSLKSHILYILPITVMQGPYPRNWPTWTETSNVFELGLSPTLEYWLKCHKIPVLDVLQKTYLKLSIFTAGVNSQQNIAQT